MLDADNVEKTLPVRSKVQINEYRNPAGCAMLDADNVEKTLPVRSKVQINEYRNPAEFDEETRLVQFIYASFIT